MISMKALACRNAGFNCDVVIRGDTEEEIMANTAEHDNKEHNMKLEEIASGKSRRACEESYDYCLLKIICIGIKTKISIAFPSLIAYSNLSMPVFPY